MSFYSFIVNNESGDVVTIPSHYLVLDMGQTAFNARVENLDLFLGSLNDLGVRVLKSFCLDNHEEPKDALYALPLTAVSEDI